jgi:hypothetical protein
MTTILILIAGGLLAAVVMFLLFVRAAAERDEAVEGKLALSARHNTANGGRT